MEQKAMIAQLRSFKAFFDRTTACLREEDSAFAPVKGMMNVAQAVAHVAQTVDWFFEGAFRDGGFDMDFEKHAAATTAVDSLATARAWLDRAFAAAEETILGHTEEEWSRPLPAETIMGGAPRFAILGGVNDHTAHHRGSLAVYARLRGLEPAMPYM